MALAIENGGDGVPNKFTDEVHIQWPETLMLKKEAQLGAKWELVKELLEEIGHEQFGVAVSNSKFMAGHIESYLEDLNKDGLGDTGDTAAFLLGLEHKYL